MPNVTLVKNTPTNLYSESGIAPGTQIRVSNIGTGDVRLSTTEQGTSDDYIVLNTRDQAQNDSGDTGAWAFSTVSGGVNVSEV